MNQPLLVLRNVSKSYPPAEPAGPPVEVLRGISFELGAGESLAIVGPSGSGKSTLLQIIGTLDTPSSGEVTLDGQSILGRDEKSVADLRARHFGFIFQSHYLLPQCSVIENVLVPTLALPVNERNAAPGRAHSLLDRVGLSHRLNHRPGQLSGGERQRVAVVRALINGPRLLLADEPTGALDAASAQSLGQLLVELNREQKVALIVVTHSPQLASLMARKSELRDGLLRQCDPPSWGK